MSRDAAWGPVDSAPNSHPWLACDAGMTLGDSMKNRIPTRPRIIYLQMPTYNITGRSRGGMSALTFYSQFAQSEMGDNVYQIGNNRNQWRYSGISKHEVNMGRGGGDGRVSCFVESKLRRRDCLCDASARTRYALGPLAWEATMQFYLR